MDNREDLKEFVDEMDMFAEPPYHDVIDDAYIGTLKQEYTLEVPEDPEELDENGDNVRFRGMGFSTQVDKAEKVISEVALPPARFKRVATVVDLVASSLFQASARDFADNPEMIPGPLGGRPMVRLPVSVKIGYQPGPEGNEILVVRFAMFVARV